MTALKLRRSLLLVAVICITAKPSFAQGAAAPAYDVVSIKLNKSGDNSVRVNSTSDRYAATNIALKSLIRDAYALKTQEQIVGLPGWANSANFDIEAKLDADAVGAIGKLDPDAKNAQRQLRMQSLLADRFQLKVHHETKEMQMYQLVAAKNGVKLKEADPNDTYPNGPKGADGLSHGGMMMSRNGQLTAQAIPIANLVNYLSGQLHRQVVDKTGLTGKYDVTLQWTPEDMPANPPDATGTNSAPSIFTALQEQLGLKLDSIKGPVDTIVVDHIEMPSEN